MKNKEIKLSFDSFHVLASKQTEILAKFYFFVVLLSNLSNRLGLFFFCDPKTNLTNGLLNEFLLPQRKAGGFNLVLFSYF